MRRGHDGRPCPGGEPCDLQSLIVDRNWQHAGANRPEESPGFRVARILECHSVARVDEYPGAEIKRLLRPGDDNHLPGVAPDPAGIPEIAGDGLAQRREAADVFA